MRCVRLRVSSVVWSGVESDDRKTTVLPVAPLVSIYTIHTTHILGGASTTRHEALTLSCLSHTRAVSLSLSLLQYPSVQGASDLYHTSKHGPPLASQASPYMGQHAPVSCPSHARTQVGYSSSRPPALPRPPQCSALGRASPAGADVAVGQRHRRCCGAFLSSSSLARGGGCRRAAQVVRRALTAGAHGRPPWREPHGTWLTVSRRMV